MKTLSHPELLVRLLSAVGLGSNLLCSNAACGNEVAPTESIADAATTGEAASDAAQMADADTQTDTSDEAIASDATPTADGDSSLDPPFDALDGFAATDTPTADGDSSQDAPLDALDAPIRPPDTPVTCASLVVEMRSATAAEVCPGDAGNGAGRYVCLRQPAGGETCESAYDHACVIATSWTCGFVRCGPLLGPGDSCCYFVEGFCPDGRPFIVAGQTRLAAVGADPSWVLCLQPDTDALDLETRAALADFWTQDALAEHASVASFSRFVLQCLSVGAPCDIVQGAQQACADEIEHARIAFGLASAYGGRPIGPGCLKVEGALDQSLDRVNVACSVAREGCIAELVSAVMIAHARDAARDPVVRALLDRIAEQELAHALLAWRYLRWALEQGDETLRRRVAQVFERVEQHVAFGARTLLPASAEQMREHGYLSVSERRRIASMVLEEVVRPAARALFAGNAPANRGALRVA